MLDALNLTSSRRMTRKYANYFRVTDRGASIHAFRYLCRRTCKHATRGNERVHSFCGFLPNPFIQDLCL